MSCIGEKNVMCTGPLLTHFLFLASSTDLTHTILNNYLLNECTIFIRVYKVIIHMVSNDPHANPMKACSEMSLQL